MIFSKTVIYSISKTKTKNYIICIYQLYEYIEASLKMCQIAYFRVEFLVYPEKTREGKKNK